MAAPSSREAIRRVLDALGEQAFTDVVGQIGSRTLRAALRLIVEENLNRARLFIPHFWAVYYHDGRGPVSPRSAKKLVFFADPKDDPRAPTPERSGQVRRLTRAEYERGLTINADRRARGLPPYMFVVDRVGPTQPRPFFDQLAVGAAERGGPVAARVFDDWMQEVVDQSRDLQPTERTVKFRLG